MGSIKYEPWHNLIWTDSLRKMNSKQKQCQGRLEAQQGWHT